ncbi:hypothetical protein IMZ48_43005 [Candidatus Bathyarchaeota archaeon]|nr:hypothetical protein [Candidatus Bathyarchaeota archaeon]
MLSHGDGDALSRRRSSSSRRHVAAGGTGAAINQTERLELQSTKRPAGVQVFVHANAVECFSGVSDDSKLANPDPSRPIRASSSGNAAETSWGVLGSPLSES